MTLKRVFILFFLALAGAIFLFGYFFWSGTFSFNTSSQLAVPGDGGNDWSEGTSFLVQENQQMRLSINAPGSSGATFTVVTPPSHGSLSHFVVGQGGGTAEVLYTPSNGFRGEDSFTFRAESGGQLLAPITVELMVLPKLVPWLEINLPVEQVLSIWPDAPGATANMDELDFGILGLDDWSEVTNEVIITTAPGISEYVYPELMNRKPSNVRIVGGLKTVNILPVVGHDNSTGNDSYDFTDLASWQALAAEAREIVEETGTNIVVWENETALWNYHFGTHTVDFTELAQVLTATVKPLDDDGIVTWWWLPNFFADIPALNPVARNTEFVNTVKSVLPKAVFMVPYSARYWWNDGDEAERTEMTNLVGLSKMIEALWISENGFIGIGQVYTPAQAIEQLLGTMLRTGETTQPNFVLTPVVELYPQGKEWLATSATFNSILPNLASANIADFPPPSEEDPEEDDPPPNTGGGGGGGGGGGSNNSGVGGDSEPDVLPPPPAPIIPPPFLPPPPVSMNNCTPTSSVLSDFPPLVGPFSFGMRDNQQVILLQKLLSTNPSFYPEQIVSGYYGPLTREAVKRFQVAYNILNPVTADPAIVGFAGPLTRGKMNEVLGRGGVVCPSNTTNQADPAALRALLQRLFDLLRPNFYPPQ